MRRASLSPDLRPRSFVVSSRENLDLNSSFTLLEETMLGCHNLPLALAARENDGVWSSVLCSTDIAKKCVDLLYLPSPLIPDFSLSNENSSNTKLERDIDEVQ